MSFTGRMRAALMLLALLPPVVAVAAVYFYSSHQADQRNRDQARDLLQRSEFLIDLWRVETEAAVARARTEPRVQRAVLALGRELNQRPDLSPVAAGLDFMEIIDSTRTVRASAHRPGLIGNRIGRAPAGVSTEIDVQGRHPALTLESELPGHLTLYAGRYLEAGLLPRLQVLGDATLTVHMADTALTNWSRYDVGELYERDGALEAVVLGSTAAGYIVSMTFVAAETGPAGSSLLLVTALVSAVSILAALAIGWYLTGRAKREVDNLIEASHRVAAGDFSTPVMAYEEGEFAQLADSFSDMMTNLKSVQRELATAEKIAAWQAMGRKIAHEVKNPLTPIAISIDELRRSHAEQLPEFDRILHETTATVKAEVSRLTQLLDQFVAFARMNPPVVKERPLKEVIDQVRSLHRGLIDQNRLRVEDFDADLTAVYDIDRIEQVLVNLIKNGIEAADNACVQLSVERSSEAEIAIVVGDTGPGFSHDVIEHAFEPKVSEKSGGFGLGLVICHRIVHDHGGTLEIRNHPEGGAEIRFTLPRNHG